MRYKMTVLAVLTAILALPSEGLAQCASVDVTFDAQTGTWSERAGCVVVQPDANGRPTLFVGTHQRVTVTVTGVNPLLYSARVGEISTTPIPSEDALAELLALVGSIVKGGALKASGVASPAPRLELAVATLWQSIRTLEDERLAIVRMAQTLEFTGGEVTVTGTSKKSDEWAEEFKAVRTEMQEFLKANPWLRNDAVDLAQQLVANETAVIKTVADLRVLLRPMCQSTGASDCDGDALARRDVKAKKEIRLPPIQRETRWNRSATYPITIARDSALADLVATSLPAEIATSMTLAPPEASTIAVQVGLLTASIDSPSWSAVADPGNPAQKIVTKTTTDRYRATPALIGSWAITPKNAAKKVHGLFEFGASLAPERPAWFLGGGLAVGSVLRIGAGGVIGRVNALEDSNDLGKAVEDSDAIRTTKRWAPGFYWTLSLSLGGLPFFSR
ncbi:MAG: hypothetical protein AB7L71_15045 [Vicinamibacterales bacterium]